MINFTWKDNISLFFSHVLCNFGNFMKFCDCKKKKNCIKINDLQNEKKLQKKTRSEYLSRVYQEGKKRLYKELSIEKLLVQMRELKVLLKS